MTAAPATIAIALPPLSPLLPDALVLAVVTVGVLLVAVVCGTPGDSGLPGPCASEAAVAPNVKEPRIAASAAEPVISERLSST